MLAEEGPSGMLLAGGTDLLPNMKRRQQVPRTVIGLRGVPELRASSNGSGLRLGAGLTLNELCRDPRVEKLYPALFQAAVQVATGQLRNMATLGGNLCLDTRCNYYDQNYEWRKAIDFCMKKDGETCWVAPSSSKCLAVSSTDVAPALMALGGIVRLVAADGEREVAVKDLYQNDGIHYLTRRREEILTDVLLEPSAGWRSTYWKLRRRGSFDFPVLSVAAAAHFDGDEVTEARVVLGAVASQPLACDEASAFLVGKQLTDDVIQEAAGLASKVGRPMDNTDFLLHWRKRVIGEFTRYALRELRGEDMTEDRVRIARHQLAAVP